VRTCALTVPLALVLISGFGCQDKAESNLAKMDDAHEDAPKEVGDGKTTAQGDEGGVSGDVPQAPEWPVDAHGVPIPPLDGSAKLLSAGAEEGRVQLRLALAEGAQYRVTTIGMLQLPLIDKPTGFAREEDISLSECKGEGAGRSCLVTHRYRNYEAEPPTGQGLEADERQVSALVTSHRMDASGLRTTDTAVQGEASPAIAEQLSQLHRLYCIRLPAEPVGVGATWRDVCRIREGGSLVTRELTWRLSKLEKTEDGHRAELEYAGRLHRLDMKGKLVTGQIEEGQLFLWADPGEPHVMRERMVFVLDPAKGAGTATTLRYQFAKVAGDGEQLLRTDGKPFEHEPQVLNDPRLEPSGATRDGELPADSGAK
jgi:hypothetical protein